MAPIVPEAETKLCKVSSNTVGKTLWIIGSTLNASCVPEQRTHSSPRFPGGGVSNQELQQVWLPVMVNLGPDVFRELLDQNTRDKAILQDGCSLMAAGSSRPGARNTGGTTHPWTAPDPQTKMSLSLDGSAVPWVYKLTLSCACNTACLSRPICDISYTNPLVRHYYGIVLGLHEAGNQIIGGWDALRMDEPFHVRTGGPPSHASMTWPDGRPTLLHTITGTW
jgi:hypothetical protein